MAETLSIQEVKTEFGKLATEFVDKVKSEVKELKTVAATLPNTETLQKMTDRLDLLETKMQSAKLQEAAIVEGKRIKEQSTDEKKAAYDKYLRKGDRGLENTEIKLLTVADNESGGFLTTPENVLEIIKGIVLVSPVRAECRVRTTSKRSVRIPKRTQTAAAVWQNGVNVSPELGPKTETQNPKYGMEEIANHELVAMADISNQDLEDSDFDLNSELNMEWTEQYAKAEGQAFLTGTGVGMPEGLLTNTAIAVDNSGNANTLTYDGLIAHIYNLQTFYASQAKMLMNRKTIGLCRRMVDSQGRPIWLPFAQSGLAGGNPPTIADIPYLEMPDMPDVAANATPILIGAFKRGYIIVDRLNIEVQRDPYTQNTKSVTRFIARKRLGGQVVLVEAFRKLQIHV